MFKNTLLVLAVIALVPLCVSAQDLKLGIKQTETTTTLMVHYTKPLPRTPFPQVVMLGIAMKEGKTVYPFSKLPFFAKDLVLMLDKPMLLPLFRLDRKGMAKVTLPFGTKGKKVYKFFLQAAYLKLTFKPGKGKLPLQGEFVTSNLLKEVQIGMGGKGK
jgi:hypothetical protein